MICNLCNGVGWVCVDHPDTPWDEGCSKCEAEGMKCVCNPNAVMPDGFKTLVAVEGMPVKDWAH